MLHNMDNQLYTAGTLSERTPEIVRRYPTYDGKAKRTAVLY